MSLFYILGFAVGANWLMILCCIIGILLAKKGNAGWIVYGIGAALTVLSVFGRISSENAVYGQMSPFSTIYLVTFIIVAVLGFVLIQRKKKS